MLQREMFHFSLQLHKHEGHEERNVYRDVQMQQDTACLFSCPLLLLEVKMDDLGLPPRVHCGKKCFIQQDVDVPPPTVTGGVQC